VKCGYKGKKWSGSEGGAQNRRVVRCGVVGGEGSGSGGALKTWWDVGLFAAGRRLALGPKERQRHAAYHRQEQQPRLLPLTVGGERATGGQAVVRGQSDIQR